MQFWIDLLSSPTVLISAFVIGAFGEAVKRLIDTFRVAPQYDENGRLVPTVLQDGRVITYRDRQGKAVPPPDALWIRIFDATLPVQPVVVGLLLGLIPWLPAEPSVVKEHYEFAGHLATYGTAGIFAKVGYDILVTTFRRFIQSRANQIVQNLGPSEPASVTPPTPLASLLEPETDNDSSTPPAV